MMAVVVVMMEMMRMGRRVRRVEGEDVWMHRQASKQAPPSNGKAKRD